MSPAFNPSHLMGVSFKDEGGSFDFWIDEVGIQRGRPARAATAPRAPAAPPAARARPADDGHGRHERQGRHQRQLPGPRARAARRSNVMHPPPIISGGMSGWASRYWDCCKPSCGWRATPAATTP